MVTRELKDALYHLEKAETDLQDISVLDVVDEFIFRQIEETKEKLRSLLASFPEVFKDNY